MAKTFLEADESKFKVINANTMIFGASATESIVIEQSASSVVMDANVERIDFLGIISNYTYQQAGISLNVFKEGLLITTIPVNHVPDIVFADGLVKAQLDDFTGRLTLGDAIVPITTDRAIIPSASSIDESITSKNVEKMDINAALATLGAHDADLLRGTDYNYEVMPGNYNQEIVNFSSGDVLDFSNFSNEPTLSTTGNNFFNDGRVQLQITDNNTVSLITLTGLGDKQDFDLSIATDISLGFDSVFGLGTIIL